MDSRNISVSRNRKFVTGVLFYTFIATGLNYNIVSSTLLQLKSLLNMSLAEVSAAFTARSAGYIISGPINACIVGPRNQNTALLTHSILMAVTIFLMPAACHLPFAHFFFYAAAGINGIASGGMESMVNVWLCRVWGKRSTPFVQALHFSFSIGCAIAPILAAQFISDQSIVLFAYIVVSAVIAVAAVLMVIVFQKGKATGSEVSPENMEPLAALQKVETGTDTQQCEDYEHEKQTVDIDRRTIVALCSLFLVTYSGTATIYNQFLPTHLQTAYSVPTETAIYIHSSLNYMSSLARLVSIFAAIRFPPQALLFFNLMMFDAGSLILFMWADFDTAIIWIGNLVIGLGMGGCTGPLLSYLNRERRVTIAMGSMFVFCNGLASVFVPVVVGSVMSTHATFLILLNVVTITLALAIFFTIYMLSGRQRGNLPSN